MVELDPVCHMQVDPETSGHRAHYKGKTYYFCREGCQQKFEANPQEYVLPLELRTVVAPPNARYVCPMHPQVAETAPGSCPLCGMALEPEVPDEKSLEENPELKDMTRRLVFCGILSLPVLFVAMSHMLTGDEFHLQPQTLNWMQFILATPVVIYGGAPILARAWQSLLNRSLNMFTLIGLGTSIAYAFSVFATIAPHMLPKAMLTKGVAPVYFETAAIIIVLVLLGQVLELRARSRAGSAIAELLALAPNTARLIKADGNEVDIPLAEINAGDILRVRPGDRIAVDGTVTQGSGTVDESMLTGEAYPVTKENGSAVSAGTINTDGSFLMRAEEVGDQTLLAQIVKLVAAAQRTQAPIQHLADKVSAYFVPAVILIAVATFAVWISIGPEPRLLYATVNAIAVLIIACPCALGLATPMSITVAAGRGAKSGILIKNASVLELAEAVGMIALDKTGTLTVGKPQVTFVTAAEGTNPEDVLAVAASLEVHSNHPLALAISNEARARNIVIEPAEDFQGVPGKGLKGRLHDAHIVIGNEHFMNDQGVELRAADIALTELKSQNTSTIFVARSHKLLGVVGLSDPVKQDAASTLEQLRQLGVETIMITGDNKHNATIIGASLGFAEKDIYADVLPDEKANVIDALKLSGNKVAMAGDGINDAIALARADIGIAMGHGTDIAMQSADITLVRGDLRGILHALKLSRATMSNIRQNLFFAFFYNAIGILIATGAFYPWTGWLLSPMIAGAAMSFSSVCVIFNALRLRRVKLDDTID